MKESKQKAKTVFGGLFGKVSMYGDKEGVVVFSGNNPQCFFEVQVCTCVPIFTLFLFLGQAHPESFSQSWRRPGRHAEGIHSPFGGYSSLQNSCETAVLCCIHTSNIFFYLCSFSLGDNPPVCRVRHGFCERRFALVSHG